MLTITANKNYVIHGGSLVLFASGGVEPYSFSLVSGGAGGSINTTSGLYSAPSVYSTIKQTILVTDANDDTATYDVSVFNHLQLVCAIIKEFTGLADDQVFIYNQKLFLPSDNRTYVSVGYLSLKPFANNSRFSNGSEELTTNYNASLKIDIFGRSTAVFGYKDRLIASLRSQISQNVQTANGLRISTVPSSVTDLSSIEGSAIPFRFNINVNMLFSIKENVSVEYYDQFEDVSLLTEEYDAPTEYLLTDENGFVLQENGDRIII